MRSDERSWTRQEHVLRLLQASAEPVGVAVLAERLGVHPNTVRFHLDALEQAGRVERAAPVVAGRGRPPLRFRAVAESGQRRYELLAGILLHGLGAEKDARARAERAGMAWGLRHAERDGGDGGDSAPVERLLGYLDDIGFAPQRASAQIVELHNCPFRESVDAAGDLVCAVHAGLMRGALEGWGAQVTVAELEPFARSGVCRARLEDAAAA